MATQTVFVPDVGGAEAAEIIEMSIAVDDVIEQDQAIVVLGTDKASMDIPSPLAGKVIALHVSVGDKVSDGDSLCEIEVDNVDGGNNESSTSTSTSTSAQPETSAVSSTSANSGDGSAGGSAGDSTEQLVVTVPDGAEDADIIELCVAVGDNVDEGDSLIVLETDKASMEVPAPKAGKVKSISVNTGDKTVAGGELLRLSVSGAASPKDIAPAPAATEEAPKATSENVLPKAASTTENKPATGVSESKVIEASHSKEVYAGPAVRKLAREMGIDLFQVKGTSDRGRISKDDVKAYVKQAMKNQQKSGGVGIPSIPEMDFSQFGEIDLLPMSKVKKLTAANMQRNWLNIPHVTQFDDADITELEHFRQGLKPEAEKRGVKLTPLPFLLKACAAALVAEPSFNVSMHHDGEHIVQKKYVNIGIAVDSPIGLVVPVIRDVDKKGLWELAEEFMAMVAKARDGKLGPKDMQGGCFTISSLGSIGGQGFTPIVNAPEVAILGVSKAEMKPKWNGQEFEPRNMLPLSLSYDHRAINGGDAGRFFSYLNGVIADLRRLLL